MSELPNGWVKDTIGNVLHVARGGSPRPIKAYITDADDGLNWIKISDASASGVRIYETKQKIRPEGLSKTRQVFPGDFLLSNSMSFGRPYICEISGCIHDGWLVLGEVENAFNHDFLYYCLLSEEVQQQFKMKASGSTVQNLNSDLVRSVDVPIPPLPEQRRIVAKLDRLSARSSAARDHLAHTTKLATRAKQAILMECLSGDWPSVALSDIAKVGTGATPKRGTPRFYDGGTIPWVTSGAVNSFKVVSADQFITPVAIDETNCKVFPAGTLLMAMYGEGKTRGMVARLEINAATNQAIAAIQIDPEAPVRDDWVIWLLHSQYLQLRELASGGVQPNLNLGMVKAIQVPAPPLVEQDTRLRKIEAAFARIDRLTDDATRAAHLLDRLDERLLAKAFRGELVPQNPEDEPAEALLTRIRQARATAPKPKRGRRTKAAAE